MTQYTQEYDELMPAPELCGGVGTGPSDWVALTDPYIKAKQVWLCPDFSSAQNLVNAKNGTPASYAWSGSASCSNQAPAISTTGNPASTFLAMDKGITYFLASDYDWCDRVNASITDSGGPKDGLHSGGKDVLFADAHVKWLRTVQIHAKDVTDAFGPSSSPRVWRSQALSAAAIQVRPITRTSKTKEVSVYMTTYDIPAKWQRGGLIFSRQQTASGTSVVGDPCIIWDKDIPGWRMFLFHDPPGHAEAICRTPEEVGPGQWELVGPLTFTNPQALLGGTTHKPWVVMDAHHPNRAARINGRFCLLGVSFDGPHKVIQQAWAERLAGPWMVQEEPLIPNGSGSDFDAKHADAVSGFHFPERGETLYYYMGYPVLPQPRAVSPWGNVQGIAVQRDGETRAEKRGVVLPPCQMPGHWGAGYLGGLQILPGKTHRWIALLNASPTAPSPDDDSIAREEPAPSLGGFAWCDEEWPVRGWQWCPEPIEWIEDIPEEARAAGEGTNLWRHHLLALLDGRRVIYYNSGYYGQEQLYMKIAE